MPDIEILPPEKPKTGLLVAHRGAAKIDRAGLACVEVPDGTDTHKPIAHINLVKTIEEALAFRHIAVVAEEFAVTPDGMRMFGLLELNEEWNGLRFSLGIRNSNDKTMSLGMVAGYRTFVCDNMAFSGEFKPVLAKHSKHFDLEETITIAIDRVQRHFSPIKEQIARWQETPVTDDQARLVIYRAFLEDKFPSRMMGDVHKEWFDPTYEAFKPRTFWSLSNAFTTAAKELAPVAQYTVTAKLGGFLEAASLPA